jgi:hypothetical protein
VDSNGGNQTAETLQQLSTKEEHEIRAELAVMYRRFTDQLMGSIHGLGAP